MTTVIQNQNIQTIIESLTQQFAGESIPAMKSQAFADLIRATTALGDGPDRQDAFASIGRQTVLLLLDQMGSTITAEREIAILRGDSPSLC